MTGVQTCALRSCQWRFNPRARANPCPTCAGRTLLILNIVSILEHERTRARRPKSFLVSCKLKFQSSSTSEPVPDARRAKQEALRSVVSILEHERTRARPVNFWLDWCFCDVSILEHERTRARLELSASKTRFMRVSILEHERTRARRSVAGLQSLAISFQSSSTSEPVPDSRIRSCRAARACCVTFREPVCFITFPVSYIRIRLSRNPCRMVFSGFRELPEVFGSTWGSREKVFKQSVGRQNRHTYQFQKSRDCLHVVREVGIHVKNRFSCL